jgi:endonuclease/exonuclease/phosphatase (EEP) superfamily protein YafD
MTGSHGAALFAICAVLTGCSSGDDDVSSPAQPSCPASEAGDVAVAADAGPDAVADVAQEAAPGDASPDTAVAADAAAPGLRIMTFNIKHGDVSSLEDVAAVIRAEEPDLVGLQEVDVDADRSDNVDQAHRLSQLTGMASLFRSALTFSSGGHYGLALLSRFPILSSTKQELTSGSEQRILVVVDVLTDDGVIAVAVTHLGLTASE